MIKCIHRRNRVIAVCADGALDWDHPLNANGRGKCVARWQALPGLHNAGGRWIDIAARNHATFQTGLINSAIPRVSPSAPPREGGYGAAIFDGTDDYASVGIVGAIPAIEAPKTLCFWTTYAATTTRRIALSLVKDDTGSASNSIDLEINGGAFANSGSPSFRATKWGGTALADVWLDSNGANLTTGQWFQLVYTYDGTTHQVYANMVAGASQTTASNTGATGVVRIASFNSAFPSPYYDRPLDDIRIFNFPLSGSEVGSLYRTSRQEFDPTLRWVGTRTYFIPTTGGLLLKRRRMMGAAA